MTTSSPFPTSTRFAGRPSECKHYDRNSGNPARLHQLPQLPYGTVPLPRVSPITGTIEHLLTAYQ